jgi:hypothetical protein
MLAILPTALALAAAVTISVLTARYWRGRRTACNPVAQAFRGREFRHLDAHLEAVACEERRRLERELALYLAGRAGYVVAVSKGPDGIALELSDGCRLALGGVSPRTIDLIDRRGLMDVLRPESLYRDAFSYRLLLRGAAGTEINVYARSIVPCRWSSSDPRDLRDDPTGD